MKKYATLACLWACLLFSVGCEKDQTIQDSITQKEQKLNSKSNSNKVQLCHKGSVISVGHGALAAHLNHGDVQLIDEDDDGFVTEENDCGYPVDCDDTDASVGETCETCDLISFFSDLEGLQLACLDDYLPNVGYGFQSSNGSQGLLLFAVNPSTQETGLLIVGNIMVNGEFVSYTFQNPLLFDTSLGFEECFNYIETIATLTCESRDITLPI